MQPEDDPRLYRWLSEILEDPEATRPPEMIVPFLAWKERITLFSAREKGGKSTLAGAAVSALSAGKDFLGEETTPATVLWISFEEHMSEIASRFVRFGGDDRRLAVMTVAPEPWESIPETVEEVAPDVIVWDSLSALADVCFSKPLDPAASTEWTRLVRWITELTRASKSSSILLHHSRKSDGKYRDSTAIGANVDVILEMYGEGTSPRRLKGVGRWEIPEAVVEMRGESFVLGGTPDLEKAVLSFVSTHPECTQRELREGVKGRNKDLSEARDRLIASGRLVNVGTEAVHKYRVRLVVPSGSGSY